MFADFINMLSSDSIKFYYHADFINLQQYFLLFADFINMLSSDSIRFYSIRVFFSQQIFMRCSMICICSNLQILLLIECLFIYIIA